MKISVFPVAIESQLRDPVAAYKALEAENSYLLESREGSEKVARYSFIGFDPVLKIRMKDGKLDMEIYDKEFPKLKIEAKDPIEAMENLLKNFKLSSELKTRFSGGFVGYFSYDLISYFIDTLESQKDVLKQPDLEFLLVKKNIIFDHLAKKSYLVSYEFLENDEKADISVKKEELAKLEREILEKEKNSAKHDDAIAEEEISSNLTKEEFMENVRIAKRYIREGDIFQVVLSQRLKTRLFNADDSFKIFENLLEINPSPYMYYLNFGERKLIGSSPEMLVRVENKEAITFPIAGTRKRGETAEEDKELERDLLRDEKERAEHVMLVDLARNDIGKVAKFGSVKVTRFLEIEKYSHVMHLVSEVKGELRDDKDALDAFKAVFPAGTVSGAPKVRAMEIISELEEEKRGIYAGSVGYVSFNGNLDSAIAIRTITLEKKDAYVQVGAGIVADSIPAKEYEETMNKGLALIKALSKNEKKSFSC